MGDFAGDEVGRALAVTGVFGTHVLGNGRQRCHKGLVIGVLLGDLRVARKARCQDDEGVVRRSIEVHAHLVVGAGHDGLQRLFEQGGGDGGIGGVEGQHGRHIGGDHAAALADGTHGAGLAAQLELDGVLFFVGVGGHDGSRRIGAALPGCGQLGRCGGDAAGKRVDDHGLADDAGGGGQNILSGDVQRLAHQRTARFGQCHTVGGAGVGVAAVDKDGLCIAVLQVGTVHLDGRTADLVGGVDTGGRAADFRFDERQIVFFVVVGPDAAMDTGRCKSSGRTDAARYFLVRHIVLPPIDLSGLA